MTIVAFVSMEIFISKNVFDFLKALFWGRLHNKITSVEIFQKYLFQKLNIWPKKKHLKHKTFCETFKTSFEMS